MITGIISSLSSCDEDSHKYFSTIDYYEINFKYEPVDYYISHYISSYISLDMKRGAIYLGEEEFYLIPRDILNTEFEKKYGSYFSGYKVFLINPNFTLMDKILKFNKLNKINHMKRKYGKEVSKNCDFGINELIENSDFVFIFSELSQNMDSEVLIFFNSKSINSLNFVKDYFESKDIFIIDKTDK
ncbi:hypothetical protein F994_02759 [Acinetobacter bohemicus ANC 3994]|uniref:Uncharacterized protein n=1 Tax=Acinetobacter bohemicus ANC 3994 TaxID=1217715 RepID=N8Q9Q3_9GAMM|nr:hypothetical protein [Acinetobacter bohemicus]ENU18632.1 hypothetical protein F994_02759 [Acinetobacter bohemicus ANC 3994]